MSLTSVMNPFDLSGSYVLLASRRNEVMLVQDQLDLLHALQPLPDCLPDWAGSAKNAYVDRLADMTNLFAVVRAEVDAAIADLDIAVAELGNV